MMQFLYVCASDVEFPSAEAKNRKFYVGFSQSVIRRLQKHKSEMKKAGGEIWVVAVLARETTKKTALKHELILREKCLAAPDDQIENVIKVFCREKNWKKTEDEELMRQ